MANLFAKLGLEAFRAGITPRTKESREWFAQKVRNMRVNRAALMRDESIDLRESEIVGSMNMFFYDPKTKDTLPYYDRFPLAIIVGPAKDGFYGLNLHYLPINLRAMFLDALLDNLTNEKYDASTRFRLTYNLLQSTAKLRYFKPCFKHYLSSNVKGNFARVPSTEWEIATFLPTARWTKGSQGAVYTDSRRMI